MSERPSWAQSPAMQAYYEHEWGIPHHDDQQLFELMCLESMQIGLSWALVLKKRAALNEAFHQFDIDQVAAMTQADIAPLLQDARLIRNRRKLEAVPKNARVVQQLQQKYGSFDAYVWHFTQGQQVVNKPQRQADIPAQSDLSRRVAKSMKQAGITMMGPVTAYSFLQGAGVIDDHVVA